MDFGKLPSDSAVDRVDFQLPEDDPANAGVLDPGFSTPFQIFVGGPVWAQKAWKGSLYPRDAQPGQFLRHYGEQINSVEVNSTYYQIPEPGTIEQWLNLVPPTFRFFPKFPKQITHELLLTQASRPTELFVEAMNLLGKQRGLSLLQLPPQFSPDDLRALDRFLAGLPAGFHVAVEFRHPGFFAAGRLIPAALGVLQRNRAVTCITDVPGRRDVSHATLSAPAVYVRFAGANLHPSDFCRLDLWIARLKRWMDQGLKRVFFSLHQPEEAGIPELIRYFSERANQELGTDLPVWKPRNSGEQIGLFG